MMRKDGFNLRKSGGVPFYSCHAFERLPGVRHGFSTRHGGASGICGSSLNLADASWDSPDRVRENRRRLLSALGLEEACFISLHQVHSNRVHIIKDISGQWNRPEGDALITRVEKAALAIRIADCIPVLIADPAHHAVGAVHTGWRGTLSGILLRTIHEMQREFDSEPAGLLLAVGPGIRACCFEVGPEVAVPFEEQYPGYSLAQPIPSRPEKRSLDLFKALEAQMDLVGVLPENRYDLGACTCCNTGEFFSHRAEGPASGRMMAVIALS